MSEWQPAIYFNAHNRIDEREESIRGKRERVMVRELGRRPFFSDEVEKERIDHGCDVLNTKFYVVQSTGALACEHEILTD